MDITLEEAGAADYPKVKALYKSAFPREERAPFFLMKRRAQSGRGQLLIARDGGMFTGFAYIICHLDMAYLFYFAIVQGKRGAGYGTRILKELQEKYRGKRLFLAREQLDESAHNYEQRVKRHEFYLRNGFEDLHCKIKEASVVYDVMGIGGGISAQEYEALISSWSGRWVRRLVDMRIID